MIAARHRRQMLQTNRLAAALHAALVVTLAHPGETRLEEIMADQRLEALIQLTLPAYDLAHRCRQIVVHAAPRNPTQIKRKPAHGHRKTPGGHNVDRATRT